MTFLHFTMSGQKIKPAPTALLSEKLEYLWWLTRLKDIQFKSELMSINFPLCFSEKKAFYSNCLRFKHQIEFTRPLLSQGFTYCHYTPHEAVQIIGKCKDHLRWLLIVEETQGGILKDLLIESNYTTPAEVLPLCLFPYNPSTWNYDQGMAHLFWLFAVPYHFSIQPEESLMLKQWKRLSRIWTGN